MQPIRRQSPVDFKDKSKTPEIFKQSKWRRMHAWYLEQLQSRESDPTVWDPEKYDPMVVEQVSSTISETVWNAKLHFHPDDPYCVVGGLQTGDLCEIEALIALEQDFGLELPRTGLKSWKMKDMVTFIMEHRKK